MKILASMPGRYGDLLWALPTVRALAQTYDTPVTLLLSQKYSRLKDLLAQQAYIEQVLVAEEWAVVETAPMTPRVPPTVPEGYDRVFHLGYPGWPEHSLPVTIWNIAWHQKPDADGELTPLDLETPWIHADLDVEPVSVVYGWSDEWFELKYGVTLLTHRQWDEVIYAPHSRWTTEARSTKYLFSEDRDWQEAACLIGAATVFVGCCSALHVLACALGTRCVLMEPNEARWNTIFYPYGKVGPRVTLVHGTDGRPTFDARHVADAIREALT